VAPTSWVSVVVMDWIRMGWLPPTPTEPTWTSRVSRRRVAKRVGAHETVFVSAGAQVLAEYTDGVFDRSYVYGSYVDEPIAMIDAAGDRSFYHRNHLFSIAAITDDTGAVVERYGYDAYGDSVALDATGNEIAGNVSMVGNLYRFTGRRLDAETGLSYFRARYMDHELGRFVGRDSLGYYDGLSLYRAWFVSNMLDPTGLCSSCSGCADCEEGSCRVVFVGKPRITESDLESDGLGVLLKNPKKYIKKIANRLKLLSTNMMALSWSGEAEFELDYTVKYCNTCCCRNWIGWCSAYTWDEDMELKTVEGETGEVAVEPVPLPHAGSSDVIFVNFVWDAARALADLEHAIDYEVTKEAQRLMDKIKESSDCEL